MSTSNAEKNKGGQKAWTTAEQREWLTEKLPSYKASRNSQVPADIWPSIFEGWFQKWALGEPDASEVNIAAEVRLKNKKKVSVLLQMRVNTHFGSRNVQQIREWFKNHSRSSASSGPNAGRRPVLDLGGKKTKARKLTVFQAYSKLYYESKVKDAVQAGWADEYLAKNPTHSPTDPIPPPSIAFRNKVTQQLYENESEDVKSEVERKRDGTGTEEPVEHVGESDDDQERERVRVARQYQSCVFSMYLASVKWPLTSQDSGIDSLNVTISKALDEIYTQTGLIGTLMLAGLEPSQGGNIAVFE
jgi:hypothetical protein